MSSATSALSDYLMLDYRADLQLLVMRWLRDVSATELQDGFAAAQQLARQHAASYWLVDVRRRAALDPADSAWVADVFLPQVAGHLAPALFAIGYLLAPFRATAIQEQAPLRATVARAEAVTQPYQLRTFLDEAKAMEWLRSFPA